MASPRPYLAFELDALDATALAANALQIKPGDVAWGLLQLWKWCWRQKKECVSDTAVQMAFGPDPRVGQVLAEAGFLEAAPDGSWRVRGASRYLRVSEARSKAGKERAAKAKRDSLGQMLDDEDTNSSKPPANGQQTTSTPPALSSSIDDRASTSLETKALSADADAVFEHWREVMGKDARTKFDGKRRRAVVARLNDGYTAADLAEAVNGCSLTPHNMGQNDRGERYDDLELICRNASQVDRFRQNAQAPPRPKDARRFDPNQGIPTRTGT